MADHFELSDSNLNVGEDLFFVDQMMETCDIEAEPEARSYLVKVAYSMAKDQLIEARRVADLSKKSTINAEHVNQTKMEKIETEDIVMKDLMPLLKTSVKSANVQMKTLPLSKPNVEPIPTPMGQFLPLERYYQQGAIPKKHPLVLKAVEELKSDQLLSHKCFIHQGNIPMLQPVSKVVANENPVKRQYVIPKDQAFRVSLSKANVEPVNIEMKTFPLSKPSVESIATSLASSNQLLIQKCNIQQDTLTNIKSPK